MHIDTQQDPEGGWYDRFIHLVDDQGNVVKDFGKHPTLGELRETERECGQRINLWQQGLVCYNCDNQINERFSARPEGHLLCWDCATKESGQEFGNLSTNVDPTKTVFSESKLYKKSLCDYVINVATGCRHGCRFCYVPSTPAIDSREDMLGHQADVEHPQKDWGSYLLYRDDLPERLHKGLREQDWSEWNKTERGRGIVMLSSGTDCYQDRRAAQITRGSVHELIKHEVPVRILTRSPNVTRDIDLFKQAGDNIAVGLSIPSFDEEIVSVIEPNAPPPQERWNALEKMQKAGIPRFVSFSPTYPTMDYDDIWEALSWISAIDPDVVFHEPINPRGINFRMCIEALRDSGKEKAAKRFEAVESEQNWQSYAMDQIEMVRKAAAEFENTEIHTWPDRNLIKSVSGRKQEELKSWVREVPNERFQR